MRVQSYNMMVIIKTAILYNEHTMISGSTHTTLSTYSQTTSVLKHNTRKSNAHVNSTTQRIRRTCGYLCGHVTK